MSTYPLLLLLLLATSAQAAEPEHRHHVQPGDTLIGVRDRLLLPEVGWQQLQRLNRVADPYRLQPGSTLRFPAAWLREKPVTAELLQLQGSVWLQRDGQRQRLQAGDLLRDGDRLISDAQSSATVRFVDGTRSLLRPSSELELQALRQLPRGARSQLELHRGAIDTEVPLQPAGKALSPRFELRTPMANLGVRGTKLRSQRLQDALLLEVLEGRVDASGTARGAKTAAVAAGQGWHSRSGTEALLPAPDVAALDGRVLQRLPVQLQWPTSPGAVGWRLQWWDEQGRQLLFDAETPQPQFIGAAELPDGQYQLRLRARSSSGLEGRDAEVRVELHARPEPPVLQAPAKDGKTYEEAVDFAWTRPVDATAYWLQIADDAAFSRLRVDERGLSTPQYRGSLPVGVHHWRVAALRVDGRPGPWGDGQTVTRLPLPPSPPPVEPQRDGDKLTLRWANSELPGARYQVQLSRQADFAAPWLDQTVDAPELQLLLQQSGTQQLRIRIVNADGMAGPWGTTQQFEGKRQLPWWLLGLPLLFLL